MQEFKTFNTKIAGHKIQVTIEDKDKINVVIKALTSPDMLSKSKEFDTEEQAKTWINYTLHRFYLDLRTS